MVGGGEGAEHQEQDVGEQIAAERVGGVEEAEQHGAHGGDDADHQAGAERVQQQPVHS
jgi:hypothetical protein